MKTASEAMEFENMQVKSRGVAAPKHPARTDITRMAYWEAQWYLNKRAAIKHKFGIVVFLFAAWVVLVDTPLARITLDYLQGTR